MPVRHCLQNVVPKYWIFDRDFVILLFRLVFSELKYGTILLIKQITSM